MHNTNDLISPAQYDSTLVKLANAEDQIDELKQRLDDMLGAEEAFEQVTEQNLAYGEVNIVFVDCS